MPKRVPPLSARALANVRPSKEPVELVDGFVPGLRVRIYPSGTRSWFLIVRNRAGERGRFHVGTGLSLAEARHNTIVPGAAAHHASKNIHPALPRMVMNGCRSSRALTLRRH